uniref:Bifunctional endo-1,4-beta-xylanase xylA n=1 Tax=Solanum tuberosum TaxID=4113 RepID=M1DQZ8_SOLTU
MEEGPSADLFRPPDPSTAMLNPNIHPSLLESSSKSSYSSSQVREEAIQTAMAERELDGTRTNVHMKDSSQIQGKRTGDKESLSQDRQAGKKSHDFTVPYERKPSAMTARNVSESPQMRHQSRGEMDTGVCSPSRGGNTTEVSSTFHGEIAGYETSGDSAGTSAKNFDHLQQDEEIYDLAHPQFHQREGKQQIHELGQASIPCLDDHTTKKQGRDSGMIPIDNSPDNVIPTSVETVRNKNNKDIDKNPQQPKGHKVVEQKEDINQQYKQHRDQEQIQHQQEDHWQIQRRKNNNQMQAPRGNNSQADQSTKWAGQHQSRLNNKSGDRLSKKKREAIKKRLQQSAGQESDGTATGKQTEAQASYKSQNPLNTNQHGDEQAPNIINKGKLTLDDYRAINSDDEFDPDNQSIDESDEDTEDNMQHTGQVVGYTFQDKCSDVQKMTEQ